MEVKIMYDTIERFMGIDSTAEGYDITTLKRSQNPHHTISRRYKNISNSTMKRFYRLSNSYSSISDKTTIHWKRHRNIFQNN